jgi:methanogenic corrinoid protein MtbC1
MVFAEVLSVATSVARVREMFEANGRDDIVIFVGGAPFQASAALAKEVGANGIVKSAESALKLVAKIALTEAHGK